MSCRMSLGLGAFRTQQDGELHCEGAHGRYLQVAEEEVAAAVQGDTGAELAGTTRSALESLVGYGTHSSSLVAGPHLGSVVADDWSRRAAEEAGRQLRSERHQVTHVTTILSTLCSGQRTEASSCIVTNSGGSSRL